jgi:alkylation response protein AidB-like acyl-CoA dehydrogenase
VPKDDGVRFESIWDSMGLRATRGQLITHAKARIVPTTQNPVAGLQWIEFGVADAHVQLLSARLLAQQGAVGKRVLS